MIETEMSAKLTCQQDLQKWFELRYKEYGKMNVHTNGDEEIPSAYPCYIVCNKNMTRTKIYYRFIYDFYGDKNLTEIFGK